jgi:hypothetical protein
MIFGILGECRRKNICCLPQEAQFGMIYCRFWVGVGEEHSTGAPELFRVGEMADEEDASWG